jgi:hypothetical protein
MVPFVRPQRVGQGVQTATSFARQLFVLVVATNCFGGPTSVSVAVRIKPQDFLALKPAIAMHRVL